MKTQTQREEGCAKTEAEIGVRLLKSRTEARAARPWIRQERIDA